MKKKQNDKIKKLAVKAGLKTQTIKVDYLARVEGEGALYIEIKNNQVKDVKLKIFEPPRFFEALLRGRSFFEAPDITSRICGICPIAYQMSALYAIEDALNLNVSEPIHALRRLLYCGEWIESHSLHVYMLHVPDFLGFDDAISMSARYPEIIKEGLFIKKCGNAIIRLLGGREIHPINIKVGGFYKIPEKAKLLSLKEELLLAREKAYRAIEWLGKLDYPDVTINYDTIALSHPNEYPMARGQLTSNFGLTISAKEYSQHFTEFQVPYSNALHSKLMQRDNYLVGPLARYNLNRNKLSKLTLEAAAAINFEISCHNPFRSIIVRSLEILYALDEAIRILENFQGIEPPCIEPNVKASMGYGITEAPRGILYHRYKIDEAGILLEAQIIPPTSQNQYTIEKDLKNLVSENLHLDKNSLTKRCEQMIRNYDPCISCSAHFLKVHFL